jgi:monovalent cation/hydrogen antiporter
MFPAIKRKDPSPPWQWVFLLAFTGVRGIVSLAAALAIPLVIASGEPFPHRDLILFLTFAVILITLVGQGLMLPWVIDWLGLFQAGHKEREIYKAAELQACSEAVRAASERLEQLATEHNLAADVVHVIRAQHEDRLKHVDENGHDFVEGHSQLHDEIEYLLIEAERTKVNELFRNGKLTDEARRRIERELDLREVHLANQTLDQYASRR